MTTASTRGPGFSEVPRPAARKALWAGLACLVAAGGLGCVAKTPGPAGQPLAQGPLGKIPVGISWADQDTARLNKIYGYNLYRSESQTGDYVKVNDDLIVPSPDKPNPDFVVFFDRGLPMQNIYYYYVEAVLQDGSRHKATPVMAKKVDQEMTREEVAAWKNEQAKKAKASK